MKLFLWTMSDFQWRSPEIALDSPWSSGADPPGQRRNLMKRIFALVFLMVLCSLSLHAAQNSLKVTLAAPTKVGTATLPVGDCKITWVVSGAEAQLTFQTPGQKPLTVPAQVVDAKSFNHALQTDTVKGENVLQSVILEKMTFVLAPGQISGN